MKKKSCQTNYIFHVALIIISLLLNGCSGIHLHNPNNLHTAISATENFEKIVSEVDAGFKKERANLDKLLNEEINSVARLAESDRNTAAAIIITSDKKLHDVWSGEEGMLGKRLKKIGVNADIRNEFGVIKGENEKDKWSEMTSVWRNSSFQKDALIQKKQELRDWYYQGKIFCNFNEASKIDPKAIVKAISLVQIESPGGTPDAIEAKIRQLYEGDKGYIQKCQELRNKIATVINNSFGPGELLTVWNEYLAAINEKEQAKKIQGEIEAAFDSARQKVKAATLSDEKPSHLINEQITTVSTIIEAASGIARLSAENTVAEQRLNNINCILAGLVKKNENPAPAETDKKKECKLNSDEQRAALVLAGLPNLADGFYNLKKILNQPPLTALMMAKGELQARLDAIKAQIAREEAKIKLVKTKFQTLIDEIINYNRVNLFVKQAKKTGDPLAKSYLEYTKNNNTKSSRALKAAIALQIYAQTNSLKKRYQAEYRLITLDYLANQEISKARVAQWYAMLKPLILQQKLYHKSGITEEQIANITVEILKAASLFTIAGAL